ncbi:hypothetical protein V2J09_003371 [Rumex salicifolius]
MMAKLNYGNRISSGISNSIIRVVVHPLLLHSKTTSQLLPSKATVNVNVNFREKKKKNHPLPPLAVVAAAGAAKKEGRGGSRRVITVSFPSGQSAGNWTYDYLITLKDLHLHDLAEDGRKHTQLHITLSLHKHAGVGLSADGRIVTSIARKCKNCSSFYSREIDAAFNVWVLPSSKDDSSNQLPELGGDPSLSLLILTYIINILACKYMYTKLAKHNNVIFVKPGYDAVLDSFIQETVRLQILVKETCSDACEKADTKLHSTFAKRKNSNFIKLTVIGVQNTASLDRRWSKLRDYKETYLLAERDK